MNRRMLVVDDEETIRWALRELFLDDGWEVHCAADGDEAAELVEQNRYGFLITDLKMPGLSGVELIRRARGRSPRMGVIVLTGYASLDSAIEALRLGAWDYVTKPCQVRYLRDRIREFVAASDGQSHPPAKEADEAQLHAFLRGEGVELASFQPERVRAGASDDLDRLRTAIGHAGGAGEDADRLTQVCVEALALTDCANGEVRGRAALVEGHLLVGLIGEALPQSAPDALRRIGTELDVRVESVADGTTRALVLSRRV